MPDTSDVESRVRAVIARLFSLSAEQAQGDLRMGNPPGWDSIGHMELLVAIENEFGIRFPTHRIAALVTVESIAEAVRAHDGH
jgi:acyl carrier protein